MNHGGRREILLVKFCFFLLAAVSLTLLSSGVSAEDKKGGLVIAFDDGYPSWTATIAPELKQAGGVATGFVNNQRVHNGDLSFEDLRNLQDKYGWEIGTHTYHHFHSPEFVKMNGMGLWIKDEFGASIDELRSHGLRIRSMVFPFNDLTPELGSEVMKRLEAFRRSDPFPVSDGKRSDGSYIATPLDLAQYAPIDQVLSWIDYAYEKKSYMFLFGHKVLPDDEFVTGVVSEVAGSNLIAREVTGHLTENTEICLVPDSNRRIAGPPIKVDRVEGNTVRIFRGDLARLTRPGAKFIVGQCYSWQLSYFRRLIHYAAGKLTFYTVHDALFP